MKSKSRMVIITTITSLLATTPDFNRNIDGILNNILRAAVMVQYFVHIGHEHCTRFVVLMPLSQKFMSKIEE